MNVDVVSQDRSVVTLCREIAREFLSIAWNIGAAVDPSEGPDADLCLWDYKSGLHVPENRPWGSRFFALVDSHDLAAFRAAHPYAEAGIVLKPLTRAVVRALVAQASARSTPGAESDESSVRADRDDILQCLMHANLQLQQYDAERTNFLGRALHDFHAPLTALSGYCGLFLEEGPGLLSEEQKRIIRRMQRSVRRLSRLSRGMFQLSVGRNICLRPLLREGDIAQCTAQALHEIQQLAEEKQLQLEVALDPVFTPLLFDSSQMEQVMVNLLENACKFSARGGSVVVKGYACFFELRARNIRCPADSERRVRDVRTPNAYRVDIVDSGPGISTEHFKSIFEEYVSYSGGQDRSRGGLGLAICRMILNQHQGRIWAENCDSGAMFSFVLPLQHADGGHGHPAVACNQGHRDCLAEFV